MKKEGTVTKMIEQLSKDANIDDIISAVNEVIEHLNSTPPVIYQVEVGGMSRDTAEKYLKNLSQALKERSPSSKFVLTMTRGNVGVITSSDLLTARVMNLTIGDCDKIIEEFQDRKRRLENGEEL